MKRHPSLGPAGAIGRGALLRHDSLAAELAGMEVYGLAVSLKMLAELDAAGYGREKIGEPHLPLLKRKRPLIFAIQDDITVTAARVYFIE
jgi:hypothetical protein